MNKQLLALSMSAALGLASSVSFAADASGPLNVSLTLTDLCSVDTSGLNGNLGSKPVGSSSFATSIGNLSITCTNGKSYMWGMGGGSHYDQGHTAGKPSIKNGSGSDYASYMLLIDDSRTTVGDGGLGTASGGTYTETNADDNGVSGTGTGSAQTTAMEIYIFSTGAAGTYTDTNTITVVWQ